MALYDTIGQGYPSFRRPDPTLASHIQQALGDARRVLNVGAGTGAYEPRDREVVAVEPSALMIAQRPPGAAPVVQARAEALPFASQSFDAAMAVLTVHHWEDQAKGLAEMARVARRLCVLTWDPAHAGFWLTQDYFPEILTLDQAIFPPLSVFSAAWGDIEVFPLLIPHDCTDGFLAAYWRQPKAYLDPARRAAISTFSKITSLQAGLGKLTQDLRSGRWKTRYGPLRDQPQLDAGYRLVVSIDRK